MEVAEGEVVDIMEALRRSVEKSARDRAEGAMVGERPAGGSTPPARRRQRAAGRPSGKRAAK
ncbi:hypothetical protein D3C83_161450 [compost metagenome]